MPILYNKWVKAVLVIALNCVTVVSFGIAHFVAFGLSGSLQLWNARDMGSSIIDTGIFSVFVMGGLLSLFFIYKLLTLKRPKSL